MIFFLIEKKRKKEWLDGVIFMNEQQWPYDGRNLLTLALFSGTHW